jgi:uncharacterized membrane protein (DUF106 family)
LGFIEDFFAFVNAALAPYGAIPQSTFLILGIALVLSLVSTIANRFLVDIQRMRSISEEVRAWRNELDRAKKSDDKKLLAKATKKQEAMMKLQSKMMWDRMKVSFIFIVPFYIIFIVLSKFYGQAHVALSPFTIPFLLTGPTDPTWPGAIELAYISWYIICSFSISLPLSRVFGVNPED